MTKKKKKNPEGFFVITSSQDKEGYLGFCETEEKLIDYLRDSFEGADLDVPDIMYALKEEEILCKTMGSKDNISWGHLDGLAENDMIIIRGRLLDGTIQLKSKVVLND